MTFDLISGLHMQIQTWHPPLWLCTHAKYYVKSGLTNVLKNANKTKNMHLFSIRIANYKCIQQVSHELLMNFKNLKQCDILEIRKKSNLVKISSVWCFLSQLDEFITNYT